MNFQQDNGFRNQLTRRVRRHSALATLFRAPSSPEPANLMDTNQQTFQTFTATDAPQDIVQATWGGTGSTEPVMPMPLSAEPLPAAPLPSPPTRAQTGGRTPGSRQVAQTRTVVTGMPVDERPTAVTPMRVQPSRPAGTPNSPEPGPPSREPAPAMPAEPIAVPPVRTPEIGTESSIADSVWQRLQTIFKRHQNTPNAPRQDENPEQVSATAQASANPAESLPTQQNAVITAPENTVRVETSNPSRTTSITNNTPDSPARIQRSAQIEKEPVSQQLSSEPIIQNEGETDSRIPALSGRAITPAGQEIRDAVTRTTADSGTRAPEQAVTSLSEQPAPEPFVSQPGVIEEIRNDVRDDSVESHPPAPFTGLNATAPSHRQDNHATANEQAVPKSLDRGAGTPLRESTQMLQTETSPLGDYIAAPVDMQSSPPSQIQRVTAPLDNLDATPSTQTVVRDAPSPEIHLRDDDTHNDTETFAEDFLGESQPVPLQEAWQVERLAAGTPAPEPVRAQGFVRQRENSYAGAIQESVSRVLNSVATEKPTSSSIEVVAPRHPRPAPMHGSGRIQRATMKRDSASVQDQQHLAVRTQGNRLTDNDGIVDTAIGPLPADLWTLIDEPVPPTVRRQSNYPHDTDTSSPESSGPVGAVTQMHTANPGVSETATTNLLFSDTGGRISDSRKPGTEPSTLGRPVITPAPAPIPQQPSRIQRVAVADSSETQSSSVEQSQSATSNESGTGQEQEQSPTDSAVDIDDLAQKVYAEVKRKLTVEWERLRARF